MTPPLIAGVADDGEHQWSPVGERLHRVLEDLVQRVAMIDLAAEENRGTPTGNAYPQLVAELEDLVRRELVGRLAERDMARTGWEVIGQAPEPVR